MDRPQKITFAEMRDIGVRVLLVYCADYRCSHSIAISGDAWPDDVRLSDIEARFVCRACGKRSADVRPDFQLEQPADQDDGLLPLKRPHVRRAKPSVPVDLLDMLDHRVDRGHEVQDAVPREPRSKRTAGHC